MARDGEWGNHVTLLAMACLFKCRIRVISLMYTPTLDPQFLGIIPTNPDITICHLFELHYCATTKIEALPAVVK